MNPKVRALVGCLRSWKVQWRDRLIYLLDTTGWGSLVQLKRRMLYFGLAFTGQGGGGGGGGSESAGGGGGAALEPSTPSVACASFLAGAVLSD